MSVLSKRWKLIWTTLPFLNFLKYHQSSDKDLQTSPSDKDVKFVLNFLSHRNHEYDVFNLSLYFTFHPSSAFVQIVRYAILHNVQYMNLDYPFCFIDMSTFNSTSIKKLVVNLCFPEFLETGFWDLPALTTLNLTNSNVVSCKFPESFLLCLPCLRTLSLDRFELPETISLPALTTLHLSRCRLPPKFWDIPALLNLTLGDVGLPKDMTGFFSTFVNLRSLTLFFHGKILPSCCIDIPNLVNLEINHWTSTIPSPSGKFMVSSPKIRNFSCVGIFPITFKVSEPENVNIKLWDSTGDKTIAPSIRMKKYFRRVACMFQGFGSARILTLDLKAIEALSAVSDFLVRCPSPFYNLKYVKVPQGYQESSISADLKCYLFRRSPEAAIVTSFPQDELVRKKLPVCQTFQNQYLFPEKSLETPVAGTGNNKASSCSSGENNDNVLWQGHEVRSEFVGLLNLVMKKYPETFEQFTSKSKLFSTMKLNMFCISVNGFIKSLITDVDAEMTNEFKALFCDLQRWGFNVHWLLNHLNYIEQHHCPQPSHNELHAIDSLVYEAKCNSRDMRTSGVVKLTDSDTSIPVNYIGHDLFSDV